jgi:hypothetical protein
MGDRGPHPVSSFGPTPAGISFREGRYNSGSQIKIAASDLRTTQNEPPTCANLHEQKNLAQIECKQICQDKRIDQKSYIHEEDQAEVADGDQDTTDDGRAPGWVK